MKPIKTYPNYAGVPTPVPTVKGEVLDERDDIGITLIRQSKNRFAVVYGLEVKVGLDYVSAATVYGCCVLHAMERIGALNDI